MKNSYDTIGNRTRDLPTGTAVPQPTAPPRAPNPKTKQNLSQRLPLCRSTEIQILPMLYLSHKT